MRQTTLRTAARLVLCAGGGSHISHSSNRSTLSERIDINLEKLSNADRQDLKERFKIMKKYQSQPAPRTHLDFMEHHHKYIKMLPKLLAEVTTAQIDLRTHCGLHNHAVTLFSHFWDSGRYKEAFGLGKLLKDECTEHHRDQIKAMGNGALFCYKWSIEAKPASENLTDESYREKLLQDIGKFMMGDIESLRQMHTNKLETHPPEIINDRYGLARAFVGFAWVPTEIKSKPKVYIALTGTRNDSQLSWMTWMAQWILTNLWCWGKRHPTGGWVAHRGFQVMADDLEFKILAKINEIRKKLPSDLQQLPLEVCIVGHSMGAAIANILALSLGNNKKLCHTCIVYGLGTPCAFRGIVKIPDNVLIKNFVHEGDVVSLNLLFHEIGDTYVLKDPATTPTDILFHGNGETYLLKDQSNRRMGLPHMLYLHETFFHEFFLNDFSFEKGEKWIMKTTTYNHKGKLEKDL
jgi:hypothetical protein